LLETEYGVVMPRRLQVEFSAVVQRHTDAHGSEVHAADLWRMFGDTYLHNTTPVRYMRHQFQDNGQRIALQLEIAGEVCELSGEGNGPIDATMAALAQAGIDVQVRSYEERAMSASAHGGDARACAFVEIATPSSEGYGVGMDDNIVTASIKAIVSAINRQPHAVTPHVLNVAAD